MHLVIAAILAASRKKHGVCLTRTRLTVGKTAGVIPFKDVIHLFTTDCLKYCCLFLIAPEHIVKLKHVSPDPPPLLMLSVFISRAPPLFHGELPHTPPWLRCAKFEQFFCRFVLWLCRPCAHEDLDVCIFTYLGVVRHYLMCHGDKSRQVIINFRVQRYSNVSAVPTAVRRRYRR